MSDVPTVALQLGVHPVHMPRIGFGVFKIPDRDVTQAVLAALGFGYRLIDTASFYDNERGVGRAIAESGLNRGAIFLTTKVWNTEQGYDQTLRSVEASLSRLGQEQLDLVLIHWPSPARNQFVESWRALLRLRQEGRIRAAGVSNFQPEHLARLIEQTGHTPAVNQVELHPYLSQPQLRAEHERLAVVTQAWSPLAKGGALLSDPVITAVAGEIGRTPAQVVLRWHLQHGVAVIPKSVTPSRMAENLDVLGFELTTSQMAALDGLDRQERTGPDPDVFEG